MEEDAIYETLKVGQQVQKYAFPLKRLLLFSQWLIVIRSELKHIELMA